MLETILIGIVVVLVVLLLVALFFVFKFARIIFIFEDDLTTFANTLIDISERLEQTQQIRALMSHPTAGAYISEALDETKYCGFLLESMVRKTRMLLKKDYTELEIDDKQLPQLHSRLEQAGIYDPEEDGEINVMSKTEAKEIGERLKRIKEATIKKI